MDDYEQTIGQTSEQKRERTLDRLIRERTEKTAAIWLDLRKRERAAWRQWFVTGRIPSKKPDPLLYHRPNRYDFKHPLNVQHMTIWKEYTHAIEDYRKTPEGQQDQADKIIDRTITRLTHFAIELHEPHRLKQSPVGDTRRAQLGELIAYYAGLLWTYETSGVPALLDSHTKWEEEELCGEYVKGPKISDRKTNTFEQDLGGPLGLHPAVSEEEGQRWLAQQALQGKWKSKPDQERPYLEYCELVEEDWELNGKVELARAEADWLVYTTPAQRKKGGPFSLMARVLQTTIEELKASQHPANRKEYAIFQRTGEWPERQKPRSSQQREASKHRAKLKKSRR